MRHIRKALARFLEPKKYGKGKPRSAKIEGQVDGNIAKFTLRVGRDSRYYELVRGKIVHSIPRRRFHEARPEQGNSHAGIKVGNKVMYVHADELRAALQHLQG